MRLKGDGRGNRLWTQIKTSLKPSPREIPKVREDKQRIDKEKTINRDDEQRFLESHAFIIVSLLFYICNLGLIVLNSNKNW